MGQYEKDAQKEGGEMGRTSRGGGRRVEGRGKCVTPMRARLRQWSHPHIYLMGLACGRDGARECAMRLPPCFFLCGPLSGLFSPLLLAVFLAPSFSPSRWGTCLMCRRALSSLLSQDWARDQALSYLAGQDQDSRTGTTQDFDRAVTWTGGPGRLRRLTAGGAAWARAWRALRALRVVRA